jgi:hypothetical protein
MKQLRFVCAQPATNYYIWQVETMINNFMEMGINPNQVDIVCSIGDDGIPEGWTKMAQTYPARFLFYKDTRITKHYISSIRPNILKQHWLKFPELKDEVILYHDCDMIFTKPPKDWITDEMLTDDNWYGSDTNSYISYDYIKEKGDDVLDLMSEIAGISKDTLLSNNVNCIGAQYLMKGITNWYWERVEWDCELLFKWITDLNVQKVKDDPSHHPIQIWCSDMWSVLWNGWKMGKNTICHPNFNFTWGTHGEDIWDKNNIFHNAGVLNTMEELFYKGKWHSELPYGKELNIKEGTASKRYWEWIQKTSTTTCLI